ncbi:MAG TPA: hypothetical protein PK616_04490 [Fibrobacteraceae bacterium]|nr:hypothetical protein [Fibrobacteraceae bacterium]
MAKRVDHDVVKRPFSHLAADPDSLLKGRTMKAGLVNCDPW